MKTTLCALTLVLTITSPALAQRQQPRDNGMKEWQQQQDHNLQQLQQQQHEQRQQQKLIQSYEREQAFQDIMRWVEQYGQDRKPQR